MKHVLIFIGLILANKGANAQLFINEISQGTGGTKEYVEFVVAGTRSCTDSTLDVRGIIFDDNAGWYGQGSFNAGSFRFSQDAAWSAVPYGSIILVYNSADKNDAIGLADDPTDADHDHVYVVPDSSSLLEVNTANPAIASSSFDYSSINPASWAASAYGAYGNTVELDDSADVLSIIDPSVSTIAATHSIGWGVSVFAGAQTPKIQFAGASGNGVFFYNTGSEADVQSSWMSDIVVPGGVDNETPGAANTSANMSWIEGMRTSVFVSLPGTPGNITGQSTVCQGNTVTYTIGSVAGASSYHWKVPGAWMGNSTDTSITLTVMHTGTISVEAVNACGSGGATQLAVTTIVPPPVPTVIAGNSSVCTGATEIYSIPSIGASNLVWNLPIGWTATDNGDSIICNVGSGGLVTVDLTTVCGTTVSLSMPVTVNMFVTPSVSISTTNNLICAGTIASFSALAANEGSTPAYQWLVNGAITPDSGATYTSAGLNSGDIVSVILTSSEQCVTANNVGSNQIQMNVQPLQTTALSASVTPAGPVCQGTTVSFATKTKGGGSHPVYQWYRNGVLIAGVTASTYSSSNLNNGDLIYPVLISNAACPTDDTLAANSIGISVNPSVTPGVTISAKRATPAIIFTAAYTGGGVSPGFQWLKNGKLIPAATGSSYTATNLSGNDTISVQMTSNDPCPVNKVVTSNAIKVSQAVSTGLSNVNASWSGSLKVYPNPSKGYFSIDVEWSHEHIGEQVQVEVLNMMGQAIYRAALKPATEHWNHSVNLPDGLAKGMYQLRLRTSAMQSSSTIMIN
jgi:hypothetical protein